MIMRHRMWSMTLFSLGEKMAAWRSNHGSSEYDLLFYPNETNTVHNSIYSLKYVTLASRTYIPRSRDA